MKEIEANLNQVFMSVQGEGPYCGFLQLFLRFSGCNLTCCYCDSPDSRAERDSYLLEREPGSGIYENRPNPVSVKSLMGIVSGFDVWRYPCISLTGGEPLLHTDFLSEFLPLVRKNGRKTYLETNGTLPLQLRTILDLVDIISMDIKLPSVTGFGEFDEIMKKHVEFMQTCMKKELFVKVVAGSGTDTGEFEGACRAVAGVSPEIPLIIQPLTLDGKADFDPAVIFPLIRIAVNYVSSVRVIPQSHKFMGDIL